MLIYNDSSTHNCARQNMQYLRIMCLISVMVFGLSSQARALSTCSWHEVLAKFSELNADTPLDTGNLSYEDAYHSQVIRATSLIQAAQMRNNLQAACDSVIQLERNLAQINTQYR
jgi:hypothetical protein